MACNFCKATPVSPCPMCEVNHTMTPRNMRKGPKKAPVRIHQSVTPPPVKQATIDAWAKQAMPVIRSQVADWEAKKAQIAANEAKMREISAQLVASAKAAAARRVMPVLPPIVAQRAVSVREVKVLGVFCDECDAGEFKPNGSVPVGMVRLPTGRIVCERCAATKQKSAGIVAGWHAAARLTLEVLRGPRKIPATTEAKTMAPVARGDWAGLGKAVDAGILSHAQAVELAASWKSVVA